MTHSGLYFGRLAHARDDAHARRSFRYAVYMAAIDLDELSELDRTLRLFSYRGTNLFSFRDRDYATALSPARTATTTDLRTELAALLAANELPAPHATRLVTNLRAFGYLFNPVSFFLNYDASGAIASVVAEVNNTYGGGFRYVLGPSTRVAGPHASFRHVRELFVSPFLPGPASYDFAFDAPLDGASLAIHMRVRDAADRSVFTASFTGERDVLDDRALAHAAARYPMMTARVIGLIHWQALKLRFARVPYQKPGEDHRPVG